MTTLGEHANKVWSRRLPEGSWDSHMHVIELDRFPATAAAVYAPEAHTLEQALAFEASLGIANMVVVQPSFYGNDNSCTLDALRRLGSHRCRAIVQFDPATTSPQTLQEWHALGVRGVRVNLYSVGKTLTPSELAATLGEYADAVRALDWVVQVYVALGTVQTLEEIVPRLNVRFCIDHLGQPSLPETSAEDAAPLDPYTLPGFSSLTRLLQKDHTFVKLSAPYRISKKPDWSDLDPLAKEVIRVAGKTRVVFATDWPHTRFTGLDIRPFVERTLEWCGQDQGLVDHLFRVNAEELWGIRSGS